MWVDYLLSRLPWTGLFPLVPLLVLIVAFLLPLTTDSFVVAPTIHGQRTIGHTPLLAKKLPIYISIGPQCSGKTTFLSQLQQRLSRDPTQIIRDVTLDDQLGVYVPVKIKDFINPPTNTTSTNHSFNRRIFGKTIQSRLQEQVELTAVLQRLSGSLTKSQFESTIIDLYHSYVIDAFLKRNQQTGETPTSLISEDLTQHDYHTRVANDLIQVVEELLRDGTPLLPRQVQLFVVEALFRPHPKTNQTAVEAATQMLNSLAHEQISKMNNKKETSFALAWGNTNTRPSDYATALAAAASSGRQVYFIVYGSDGGGCGSGGDRSDNDVRSRVSGGVFLPPLEFPELLRRNLQRLIQTGKYVPAKGIWESTERVERLVRTVMGSLDMDVKRRGSTEHDHIRIPVHSKLEFDKKLAELANYELLDNRTVRHVPPQGQRQR